MASVNKVILVGNLGADPETRYTPDNRAICNIRIATTDRYKDKSGEMQERTEWHTVVFFGRLAEIAGEYLKKGRSVYIEGRLQTRKWQDKTGADRYSTEVIASEMQMLGGSGGGRSDASYGESGMGESRSRGGSGGGTGTNYAPAGGGGFGDPDDDIPF